MIRVIVELEASNGNGSKLIQTLIIWNDGTGTHERGNYSFSVTNSKENIEGYIKDFPRLKEDVWSLILRVLKQVKEKQNE